MNATRTSTAFDVTGLDFLMARGPGSAGVRLALIDGPCDTSNEVLRDRAIERVGTEAIACGRVAGPACGHGTFVASVLFGRRDSAVAGICPGCTFLLRPIYHDRPGLPPRSTVTELARAIEESLAAGADVIAVSSSIRADGAAGGPALRRVLDNAAARQVPIVAAAGNEARLGGSVLTQHPWVIPVVAVTLDGRLWPATNLGLEMARHGVAAPGVGVAGYHPSDLRLEGTSVAAPLVAGALALLASEFPRAGGASLRAAVRGGLRARTLVPPQLDARAAHRRLAQAA